MDARGFHLDVDQKSFFEDVLPSSVARSLCDDLVEIWSSATGEPSSNLVVQKSIDLLDLMCRHPGLALYEILALVEDYVVGDSELNESAHRFVLTWFIGRVKIRMDEAEMMLPIWWDAPSDDPGKSMYLY